jgi:hypothetical protein
VEEVAAVVAVHKTAMEVATILKAMAEQAVLQTVALAEAVMAEQAQEIKARLETLAAEEVDLVVAQKILTVVQVQAL